MFRHVSDAEYSATKRRGRPPAERINEHVNLRLDAQVLSFSRAGGAGWQTRLNAALAAHVAHRLKRHQPES